MILHLDLDCFFVSAHRAIDTSLENIAVAVGGRSNLNIFDSKKAVRHISSNSGAFVSSILSSNDVSSNDYFIDEKGRKRGIITTSSYEARACGVKTAMSVNEALSFCPHLKMIAPNYPLYHELSEKLAKYLNNKAPYVEQFSIDEFFVDVTGWIDDDNILEFAKELKNDIKEELKLPISIGIAKTKWIAKLATEAAKPNGIKLIKEDEVDCFIKNIPIEKFPGIGKAYEKRLLSYGIKKLGQIKDKRELFYSWKKPGIQLYNRICGLDKEKILKKASKKSIGIGRTFDPLQDRDEIKRRIMILCRYLSFLVNKSIVTPQTFFIKIKYEYNITSKNYINTNRLFTEVYFKKIMLELFEANDIHPKHYIVQLNLTVGNFIENKIDSFNLFNYEDDLKQKKLNDNINELREKYGIDIIKNAKEL